MENTPHNEILPLSVSVSLQHFQTSDFNELYGARHIFDGPTSRMQGICFMVIFFI
jgi:hypothetical protein